MKTAIQIINDSVNEIECMNFNGYQRNLDNSRIVSYGKDAIRNNDKDLTLIVIKMIAKNVNGFKSCSIEDKETRFSINAKEFLNNSVC